MKNETPSAIEPEYITVAEAARRASLAPRRLANLISLGKVTRKHGLRRPPGCSYRICWPEFKREWLDARGAF